MHDKTKLNLPGPAQYTLPSEFGLTSSKSMATIPMKSGPVKHARKNAALTRQLFKEVGSEMTASPTKRSTKVAIDLYQR